MPGGSGWSRAACSQAGRPGIEPGGLVLLPVSPDLGIFLLFSADLIPAMKYSTQLVELC